MDSNIVNKPNEPAADGNAAGLSLPSPPDTGERPDGHTLIAWERRRRMGRILAFWKTVVWVLARNGRIREATGQPVDWYSARSFRAACVRWAMLYPLVAVVYVVAHDPEGLLFRVFSNSRAAWKEGLVLLAGLAMLFAVYRGMAGIVSWLFCPRTADIRTQNRAIALSCYLCAPVALLAPLTITLPLMQTKVSAWMVDSGAAWAPTVILVYWAQLVVCGVWSVLGGRVRRTVVSAVVLVVSWAVWVAAVGTIPLAAILWLMMIGSLT